MNGKFCVYIHVSPVSKVYVGITSQTTKRRWRDHGEGYKKQKHFYNAILKYGWESFLHNIVFKDLDFNEAKEKEIELIKLFKSDDRRYGYNATPGGDNRTGHSHTEETKRRLAEIQRGRKYSEDAKRKMSLAKKGKCGKDSPLSIPVLQLDMEFNVVAKYAALSEACRITGIPDANIAKVAKGERRQAGGYIWRYADNGNVR